MYPYNAVIGQLNEKEIKELDKRAQIWRINLTNKSFESKT